jgi:hypothetical protein
MMERIHARCAGLDVHKQTVVACVRLTTAGLVQREVRTFSTTAAASRSASHCASLTSLLRPGDCAPLSRSPAPG